MFAAADPARVSPSPPCGLSHSRPFQPLQGSRVSRSLDVIKTTSRWSRRPGHVCLSLPAPPTPPTGCRRGVFGPGCALHCSCGGGADCDPVSGQCLCVDGYTGPTCRQGESGSRGARGGQGAHGVRRVARMSPSERDARGVCLASAGQSVDLPAPGPWVGLSVQPTQERQAWAQTAEGGDPLGRAG